jgi:anti-sigma B factor antagonist
VSTSRQLQIEVHAGGRAVVIDLAGELDLRAEPRVQKQLMLAFRSSADLVIVDLRRVEFMDSTGLAILVNAARAAPDSNTRFALVRGCRQVERLLSLSHADALFVRADTPEALTRRLL